MARVLLAALFAVTVYRAATQSVTPGEAATYNRYVGPGLQDSFSLTSANNHVLFTLLARISTSIFHLTDLSLRLPALVGCVLYFWAVYRLARRMFGTGPLLLAAVALLTLNPLVLDYLSMARGYGLGLAFFMWAWVLMLENLSPGSGKLKLAGICLGLSVASNLTFLVPAVGLGTTVGFRRRFHDFWLPGFVTAFLILVIPLDHLDLASFRYGATSLRQTLNSLTALSLFHGGVAGMPGWVAAVVRVAVGLVAVGAVFTRRPGGPRYWPAIGFAVLEVGHRVLGIPFPVGRSGLYFIPILTVAALGLAWRMNRKWLEWAMLLVPVVYVIQFNVHQYGEWPEYSGARTMVKAIRRDSGPRPLRIAASRGLDEVFNYYRARYALGAWAPVQTLPAPGAFDYYALKTEDAGLVSQRHLQVVWRDANLTVAR